MSAKGKSGLADESEYTLKGTVYSGDYSEFSHANAKNPLFREYYKKNKTLRPLFEQAQRARFAQLQQDVKLLSIEESQAIIDQMQGLYQWFANEDSSVKPKIMRQVLEMENALSATLSMAYHNYLYEKWNDANKGNKPLSFRTWLRTPMNMFRGGNKSFVDDDKFISYSASKAIAEKFDSLGGHKGVNNIRMKPIDTFGQFSQNGEYEFLIPTWKLRKQELH